MLTMFLERVFYQFHPKGFLASSSCHIETNENPRKILKLLFDVIVAWLNKRGMLPSKKKVLYWSCYNNRTPWSKV